jgi:hypothetical protein
LTRTLKKVIKMYNKGYGGKMRSLLILVAILSIVITSMSCLPTKTTTPTISAKDVEQDTGIAEVKRSVQSLDSNKVSADTFNTLKGRVDTMEVRVNAGVGGGNSYDKSLLYTKAEVNQAITDAITALKAAPDQTWIKGGGGSSGGGTTTPFGNMISSNGDLELYLEKDMDSELYVDDNQAETFFLSIKNKGTSGTYYRLNANFDLEGDVSTIALIEPVTLTCENSSMVTFSRSTTIPGTVSGLAFTSQAGSSGSKIWIGKNTTIDLVVVLKINYTDPAVSGKLWTWDYSIRQLN